MGICGARLNLNTRKPGLRTRTAEAKREITALSFPMSLFSLGHEAAGGSIRPDQCPLLCARGSRSVSHSQRGDKWPCPGDLVPEGCETGIVYIQFLELFGTKLKRRRGGGAELNGKKRRVRKDGEVQQT